MSDKAIIVKIDLNTSPDDYIKRHLSEQSKEQQDRIAQAVHEKALVDRAVEANKRKNQEKTTELRTLFTELFEAGEAGLLKAQVLNRMTTHELAKSSSGATLKLKSLVKSDLVGYELQTDKTHYRIVKVQD